MFLKKACFIELIVLDLLNEIIKQLKIITMPILKTIKIGRFTYDIRKGDYILDNGACIQFITGDRRTLISSGFDRKTSLRIPKTTVKKIISPILDSLRKVEKQPSLTYYYF